MEARAAVKTMEMEENQTASSREDHSEKQTWRVMASELLETIWTWTGIPLAQGKMIARRDLRNGRLILKTFGKPASWRNVYAEMLQNDYQITLEAVSDGEAGPLMRSKIRGYNSVVKTQIREKHGKDFLDMVVERAKDRYLKEERRKM